jgi:serine/threonine protein kinase
MVEQVLKERYAIQKQLGKNGGRQTLLARDLQTQELVAIKIITFDADFHWDDLKLFEREAQTLQSLSYPAIPRYLDHFKFQTAKTKGFALVQSYIPAKSLAEWVELGRTFNEDDIKHIAKALLEILMYLHAHHPPVIHRDIKPSNILLANRSGNSVGQVYLVDFGSVQTLAATEGSTITVVGTYGYMPPEQFGGRGVPASDLYSLGVTLIYLVTGTHPADLPQEDLRIQFEPKIPLDSAFVDWLQWMTEPDLNRRLTSSEQALKALAGFEQREEICPVINKPNKSKIQLNKEKNSLEIFIPAPLDNGNFLGSFFKLFLTSLIKTFLVVLGAYITYFPFTLIFLYFFAFYPETFLLSFKVFIALVLVYFYLGEILFNFQWTRLQIDRHKINLIYECCGAVRYQFQPSSSRESICKLKLGFLRNVHIWAGTRQYELLTAHLTDNEIDWIARELSEWLNLPITK